MLRDSTVLAEALTKHEDNERNNDLVQNFVNFDNPVLAPISKRLFNLQISPSLQYAVFGMGSPSFGWLWFLATELPTKNVFSGST